MLILIGASLPITFTVASLAYGYYSKISVTLTMTDCKLKSPLKAKAGIILMHIFLIVNKSHEKAKTNNVLVHLSILSDFPLSVALRSKPIGTYC